MKLLRLQLFLPVTVPKWANSQDDFSVFEDCSVQFFTDTFLQTRKMYIQTPSKYAEKTQKTNIHTQKHTHTLKYA